MVPEIDPVESRCHWPSETDPPRAVGCDDTSYQPFGGNACSARIIWSTLITSPSTRKKTRMEGGTTNSRTLDLGSSGINRPESGNSINLSSAFSIFAANMAAASGLSRAMKARMSLISALAALANRMVSCAIWPNPISHPPMRKCCLQQSPFPLVRSRPGFWIVASVLHKLRYPAELQQLGHAL